VFDKIRKSELMAMARTQLNFEKESLTGHVIRVGISKMGKTGSVAMYTVGRERRRRRRREIRNYQISNSTAPELAPLLKGRQQIYQEILLQHTHTHKNNNKERKKIEALIIISSSLSLFFFYREI
jgi:hypothetical protein